MKKKHFLGLVVLACMAIAWVANEYPIQTLMVGAVLIPICCVWIAIDNNNRQDKRFKEREQAWRHNCDLPHRKGQ